MADGLRHSLSASLSGSLGLLDKAWEWKWALRVTQAVLFFDLAMFQAGLPGLVDWDSSHPSLMGSLGFLFIAIAGFTLYASLLVPFVSALLRPFLLAVPGLHRLTNILDNPHCWDRPHNCVTLSELRDYAFDTNDEYWLERYSSTKDTHHQDIHNQIGVGNLMLGTLILGGASWHPSLIGISHGTILSSIISNLPSDWSLMIGMILSLSSMIVIFGAWFASRTLWIEHPPLYRKVHPPNKAYLGATENDPA